MGNQCYWLVTQGNISTMMLLDFNNDGLNEVNIVDNHLNPFIYLLFFKLALGFDDGSIKIYKDEILFCDIMEASKIINIMKIDDNSLFAFSTQNGILGMYDNSMKLWRIKVT